MKKVCILVETETKPGKLKEVVSLLKAHAKKTLDDEPGCLQFDVITSDLYPERLFLVEVYDSETSRALHLKNPRLLQIQQAQAELILNRRVIKADIAPL
jgi:hypothetical protein